MGFDLGICVVFDSSRFSCGVLPICVRLKATQKMKAPFSKATPKKAVLCDHSMNGLNFMNVKMNLKTLTPDQLLSETKIIVSEERRITAKLIEYLTEINQRLLFLKLGYSSLFEFVTKELGLSEGAAQRRIQCMRLMQDLPETRKAYEQGTLSLSNGAKLQSHFQAIKKSGQAKTIEEKKQIAKHAENKSQSECDQMLSKLAPELPKPDKARVLSPTVRELKFSISEDLFKKIERLKELLSHSHPNATLAEFMELLVTSHLTKLEKTKGLRPEAVQQCDESSQKPEANNQKTVAKNQKSADQNRDQNVDNSCGEMGENPKTPHRKADKTDKSNLVHTAAKTLPAGIRVTLPVQLKRQVWSQADGKCEYEYQGHRCESRYQLEIDHVNPLALGGSNDLANCRILCRRHNGLAAIQALGAAKMSSFTGAMRSSPNTKPSEDSGELRKSEISDSE